MTARPPINLPPALALLALQERWVVWQWVTGKNGKRTKPPFRADAPSEHASSTNAATWCTLDTAMNAYVEGHCDGIGFCLQGSGVCAFDIDRCRDAGTGELHPWAQDLIRRCSSYAEVTPSGQGVRIIGLANGPPVHRKFNVPETDGVIVEIYRKAERYITVTGAQIDDAVTQLADIDALADAVVFELDGARQAKPQDAKQEKPRTDGVANKNAGHKRELDDLIKNGCGEDFGGDRSRAVWFVVNALLKQGKTVDEIVAVLLDRDNGISLHIYDHSKPEEYARKQVEKAKKEQAEDPDVEIARLAKLTAVQYERERKAAAEKLDVRASILDKLVQAKRAELGLDGDDDKQGHALDLPEPEPWPDSVDGGELLDAMADAIRRYVVLADHAAGAAALWIIHTYLLDSFLITPRLAIRSPTHRCGKTTLLDVISRIVTRPLPTTSVTAAAIFRVVEKCRPTLIIDEADTFLPEAEELRGVINSGHRWGGAVIRTVGDDHEPRTFSTYGACAIGLIGKLPATLHDRSVVIDLKRRLRSEQIVNFRSDRTGELDQLGRKVARWAADHADLVKTTDPQMPAGLFNRDADNWRPLLAIAEAAGGEWPERAREVAALCCAAAGGDDAAQIELLLGDMRDAFGQKTEMPSADLIKALVALEGRPWAELGKNRKPVTQNRLARMLKPLGIAPQQIGPKEDRMRGYVFDHFLDAFARYLDPEGDAQPSTRPQRDEMGTSAISQPSTISDRWTVGKRKNPNNDGQVDGRAVAKGGAGENASTAPPDDGEPVPPDDDEPPPLMPCAYCGRGEGRVFEMNDLGRGTSFDPASGEPRRCPVVYLHESCSQRFFATRANEQPSSGTSDGQPERPPSGKPDGPPSVSRAEPPSSNGPETPLYTSSSGELVYRRDFRNLVPFFTDGVHAEMRKCGTTDPDLSALNKELRRRLRDMGVPRDRIEYEFQRVMDGVYGKPSPSSPPPAS
jgi:Protein of unknown function (DUF3631)